MSSRYKLTFNSNAATAAINKAFSMTAVAYDRALTEAITSPVYDWPIDESPRDIVDTGTLRSNVTKNFGTRDASWNYNTEYAPYVFYGYVSKSGNSFPSRNWVQVAQQKVNLPLVFQTAVRSAL